MAIQLRPDKKSSKVLWSLIGKPSPFLKDSKRKPKGKFKTQDRNELLGYVK